MCQYASGLKLFEPLAISTEDRLPQVYPKIVRHMRHCLERSHKSSTYGDLGAKYTSTSHLHNDPRKSSGAAQISA